MGHPNQSPAQFLFIDLTGPCPETRHTMPYTWACGRVRGGGPPPAWYTTRVEVAAQHSNCICVMPADLMVLLCQ